MKFAWTTVVPLWVPLYTGCGGITDVVVPEHSIHIVTSVFAVKTGIFFYLLINIKFFKK
jgi:small neutral amino acid transporter SnatA (MarC family)